MFFRFIVSLLFVTQIIRILNDLFFWPFTSRTFTHYCFFSWYHPLALFLHLVLCSAPAYLHGIFF